MTLGELLESIEFQGECRVAYYDEETDRRVEIVDKTEVYENTVLYIYPENNTVYIEVER